jgi:fermentation-respiration switch protein FrsA (DUF1100 family)
MKSLRIFFVILSPLLFCSCFKLDDTLFNQKKLPSYNLSTAIIPDSNRSQVTMTSQGKKIYGYFVRSNGLHPDITVLYSHGNRDHLQYYWDRVELFYKMGFNVFVYDYQGFGMSEGEPSESGIYSDAQTALGYLLSRGDVNDSNIVFYGYSLGCVAAVNLAAYSFTPRVLILEAPFASGTALVQSGTLLDVPGSFVLKGEFDNAGKIRGVHTPLLLLHGEIDSFIDIDKNSGMIYENANNPKRFVRVPGANHTNIPWKMGEQQYSELVTAFILVPTTT